MQHFAHIQRLPCRKTTDKFEFVAFFRFWGVRQRSEDGAGISDASNPGLLEVLGLERQAQLVGFFGV